MPLVVLSVLLGVFPGLLLNWMEPTRHGPGEQPGAAAWMVTASPTRKRGLTATLACASG